VKRPFKGLRSHGPEASYDVVVIGAGVGGLVCANLLAREGLSVLLVEQHYMVGGYCSTFRRGGYTFDAASHFYPLLGNPETITGRLLAELGATCGWVKMDPVDTFHFPDGSRFAVPADFDAYRALLDAEFPAAKEHLVRFFEEVREAYLLGLLRYFRERRPPALERYRHLTVAEVLDRHFDDRKLKLLLTADSPHWGAPPSRTSFVFDSMLRISYFLGNYYPEMGSQAFVDDLARCFEEAGGHILMSTRVDRIVTSGGPGARVEGVEMKTDRGRLEGRWRVKTGTVVSNADLAQTLDRLLEGPAAAAYRESMRGLRPSQSCFLTHVGLSGVPRSDLEQAQGYYWRSWDAEEAGGEGLWCKIFVPTLYEPRMAPQGGQVVILQKVQDLDYEKVADWPAHKAAIESRLTGHFERVLPGVSRHVVVKLSASARTSQRFTLNQAGSMLGWEMSPEQLGDRRPDNRGPVDGLWLVGHWTRPGGGITPVMISAVHVARAIAASQ
jgi:phytoene desaturase